MKRYLTAAFAAMAIVPAVAGAQAQYNLRWAHYLPNSAFLEVENQFAENVEKRTGGKVKITPTYAGGLGGPNEILALAGRGAVDFATSAPGYYPDRLPLWKASQLPFVFDSPNQAIETFKILRQEFPSLDDEMKQMGIRFLYQQPLGAYYLVGPKEGCDTLAGLNGKKVRAFGADVPKIVSSAGAVPVTLTTTENYEGIQRGIVDYGNVDTGNLVALKIYEVGKVACGPVMTFSGHIMAVGDRTWNRLPKEYQDIIMEEAAATQQRYLDWVNQNVESSLEALQKAGMKIVPIQPEEMAKWKAQTPDLIQLWVEESAKRGKGEEAQKIATRWRELLAQQKQKQ